MGQSHLPLYPARRSSVGAWEVYTDQFSAVVVVQIAAFHQPPMKSHLKKQRLLFFNFQAALLAPLFTEGIPVKLFLKCVGRKRNFSG
jgi:hypothetical protein